jgi:adenosylmethionine---8-amino-7-oxononanoate aminotransferase
MSGSRRDEIIRLDKGHVWHPYTDMEAYIGEVDPLVVERARGSRLFDVDGRSYLDAISSWWVATLGHNHPRLVAALAKQAESFCHTTLAGVTHEPAARLAAELAAIAPGPLRWVFYSDDGSTAVEAAIKMALKLWANEGRPARTRFVALDGAFHGETLGVTSLGGVEIFRRPFAGVLMECLHAPPPIGSAPGEAAYEQAFDALSRLVRSGADTIAAVVLEPVVQGASGMRIYPPAYLTAARELCREHDVLFIVDEVFTGYGRTGPMWASQLAGITPDILCTAKGFTGGILPMAATLATERVFDAFRGSKERAFHYGHSYCGHALGAAVAREVLAVYRDEDILGGVAAKAAMIERAFVALESETGARHARALGMIGAIDLAAGADYLGGRGWRCYEEARRRGAYLRPLGDVVYVAPPLDITHSDLEELLTIVDESVRAVMT